MKSTLRYFPMIALLTALALCWRPAEAVNPQFTPSASSPQYLVAATAKAVPMLQGICFLTITNDGSGDVFLGYDALVDDGTETVDQADGGSLPDAGPAPSHRGKRIGTGTSYSLTITFQLAQGASQVWLYSRAGDLTGLVTAQGGC